MEAEITFVFWQFIANISLTHFKIRSSASAKEKMNKGQRHKV
jgi:hypothetical protein